jgi:chromosome partitioning protein
MGVICFSSLKGGVGKTTLSLNTAAAFANKGGEVLLIDLDPTAHTTRFFMREQGMLKNPLGEAPLARLAFTQGATESKSIVDFAVEKKIPLIREVRERLVLLPSGAELRHLLWGRGAHALKTVLPKLIAELRPSFDYIIIDTAPDFTILVRNAIASSDLVVVPVDGSAMSIDCLEQLVQDAGHIRGPQWVIARSMFSKQASRIRGLANQKIEEHVPGLKTNVGRKEEMESAESIQANHSSIYLLDSVIYRSEEQNKLSFIQKTAFEHQSAKKLSEQYATLASELDAILQISEDNSDDADSSTNKEEQSSETMFNFMGIGSSSRQTKSSAEPLEASGSL